MFINLSLFFYFFFIFFLLNLLILIIALDHFIILLIFLDLLILSNIILFIVAAFLTNNVAGYSYALILLGIAAADTAVGLGLFILYYKASQNVSIKEENFNI